jgi:hypothetical protein
MCASGLSFVQAARAIAAPRRAGQREAKRARSRAAVSRQSLEPISSMYSVKGNASQAYASVTPAVGPRTCLPSTNNKKAVSRSNANVASRAAFSPPSRLARPANGTKAS